MTKEEKERIHNAVELLQVGFEMLNVLEDEVDDEGREYIKQVVNSRTGIEVKKETKYD